MAKTLIGNIKGKNGRGITSIKKTSTDGSVDTYTITYTDSTTSTFTVNNSDNVLLQRQVVPSAAVESSATASQAYAAGDYVVVNGVLRKAKSAIAKGNVISDSNSAATTVTGELATLGGIVNNGVYMQRLFVSLDTTFTIKGGLWQSYMLFGQSQILSLIDKEGGSDVKSKVISGANLVVSGQSDGTVEVKIPGVNGYIIIFSFDKFTAQ